MAIELRTENSYWSLLRIASIVGAVASVGLLIWMLVQHWQAFMGWKAEAGFWPFFAGLAVLPRGWRSRNPPFGPGRGDI
jgi:hypothetical protein